MNVNRNHQIQHGNSLQVEYTTRIPLHGSLTANGCAGIGSFDRESNCGYTDARKSLHVKMTHMRFADFLVRTYNVPAEQEHARAWYLDNSIQILLKTGSSLLVTRKCCTNITFWQTLGARFKVPVVVEALLHLLRNDIETTNHPDEHQVS